VFSKIKSVFGAQDMTVGSPVKPLLIFTVPLLLGNILQLFYSTVDSIVVGQFCGPNGLSAIGVSMHLQFLFAVFFMAIGTGVGVLVSQFYGAKDRDSLTKTVGSAIFLVFFTSLFATGLGLSVSGWVFKITNCPPEIFDDAQAYVRIIFLGFIGMAYYNILGGVLRGVGNSTFPLVVLIGTTLLNVFLDIWMVATPDQLPFGLGLGVAGAAWATIISQAVSAIACLIRLVHMKDVLALGVKTIKLTKNIVMLIVRIGLPGGLQQMIMSMSFMLVQSYINAVKIPFNGIFDGAVFVAVHTAVMRIDQFAMMPGQAFNMTASTFAGQNIGAGKTDRVIKGFKVLLVMSLVASAIVISAMLLFSSQLLSMFINDPNPARTLLITDIGSRMIRIMLIGYGMMAVSFVIGGVLRGAGDTMTQLIITIVTNIAFRLPLTIILVNVTKSAEYPGGKPEAIYLSMIFSFTLNLIVNGIYFSRGKWKTRSVVKQRPGLDTISQ